MGKKQYFTKENSSFLQIRFLIWGKAGDGGNAL